MRRAKGRYGSRLVRKDVEERFNKINLADEGHFGHDQILPHIVEAG
jgi:hypothetical protein